jgi:mono/diheme cytochrome c family protein
MTGRLIRRVAGGLACLAVLVLGGLLWRGQAVPTVTNQPAPADAATVARGALLARVGGCVSCHSQPGQPALSGGAPLRTPFGQITPGNLTPDPTTGLGRWDEGDFWRALHHGQAPDGRLLSPAFPYTATTLMPRADVQALWAWLQTQPPAQRAAGAPALRWPYNSRWALAMWRGLFFTPGEFQPDPARSAGWNRGAYLVRGPGHCGACHDSRNALGAARDPGALDGQFMPDNSWWAPSLRRADEAGVQDWSQQDVVALLHDGHSDRGRANGPMADVVWANTRALPEADLQAMATYLRSLPVDSGPPRSYPAPAGPPQAALGAELYRQHCADCHGAQGQGRAGIYPPLAGNRLVTMALPHNLARSVMAGGFAQATAAEPQPYSMPPYGALMSDDELAAVLSFVRSAWGHRASPVGPVWVNQLRSAVD